MWKCCQPGLKGTGIWNCVNYKRFFRSPIFYRQEADWESYLDANAGHFLGIPEGRPKSQRKIDWEASYSQGAGPRPNQEIFPIIFMVENLLTIAQLDFSIALNQWPVFAPHSFPFWISVSLTFNLCLFHQCSLCICRSETHLLGSWVSKWGGATSEESHWNLIYIMGSWTSSWHHSLMSF